MSTKVSFDLEFDVLFRLRGSFFSRNFSSKIKRMFEKYTKYVYELMFLLLSTLIIIQAMTKISYFVVQFLLCYNILKYIF